MTGRFRERTEEVPPGMAGARQAAERLLQAIDIKDDQLLLGGFSQGAMLTTELLTQSSVPAQAAVLLSGTLLSRHNWQSGAAKRKGLPFFQSHGRADPLLPFAAAEQLYKILSDAGLQGEFVPFSGGHEIPGPVLQKLQAFLDRVLAE